MDARFSGTIVFISAFYNRTGIAGGARIWAKALYDAGINVKIVSVNDVQPGVDDCDLNFLKSLEQTPVRPPVTAIFFHNPSEAWFNVQLPEPYLRVMLTGFVGENVPADWVDICNRMDLLCIQSEAEKNAWIASGTNPHKVHVLPAPHQWQFLPIVPLGSNRASRSFRFLSIGTFSPNRRWDALIQAYLEEFKDNDQVELYLRVNYPSWHPVPGQPQRDLLNLINTLRAQTQSDAKIIIDDSLGTRLDIMRLMDSCDVYASTDVSVAAPVGEAIFRRKVIVAAEVYNSEDMFSLPSDGAIFISVDNAEKIVVQGEMLTYLPQYTGVSWPKLEISAVMQALHTAYRLLPSDRQKMVKAADSHYRAGRNQLAPLMIKTIKNAWAYKQQINALNNAELEPKLTLINQYRQQQQSVEALPLVNQVLKLAPRHSVALALCGLVLLDVDELASAESVWRQLPWYTSLDHPEVMALLEGLLEKGSGEITPQHIIELARAASSEGAWPQTIKLFKMALEQSSQDRETALLWGELAHCYHQLGDDINARDMLETAHRLAPDNKETLLALAKHYLHREQYAKASEILDYAVSKHPNDANLLILQGNCAIEQQKFAQAFDIFQQVRLNAPQTLALEVTLEQLAEITGEELIPAKTADTGAGRRPQMEASSFYTRTLLADVIARHGFEIGEFTYGKPVIRWWGEDVKLKIGRYCSIADNVKIYLGGNYRHNWVTTYPFPSPPMNQDWPNVNHRGLPTLPTTKGDVIIGHDVWIGDDAVILSGITVGHGAVIAARTVVTKNVPPFAIVGGNPGKIISYRFSEQEIEMLLKLKWWDWNPAKVNNFMPYLCAEDVTGFYDAVKKAAANGEHFPEPSPEQELFTGERAMPLAPNMLPQVMREHWARYKYVAPLVAGKRVLDVACGAGYGADLLAETAQQVAGGDISPETVAYSQKHYRRDNLTFEVMDVRDIPYPDNSFDMVVTFETIEHIVEGEQFLSEIVRLLDGDGVLIMSTPLGGPVGNPHHVAYFQQGTFAAYLSAFFEDVQMLYQRDDKFFENSLSPAYASTFTGEYAFAICQKPKPRLSNLTSIIILAHNQLDQTQLCLQSIEQHTPEPHELIIVDNGSTDGTLDFLRQYAAKRDNVRVVSNATNLGFAAGNNQGLALANGDTVLLLNNDTVVTEGWLANMLAVFQRHPEVGIVGPVSNNISGPQRIETGYRSLDEMHPFARQWSAAHQGQSDENFRVVGFCLLARREVIDRIGGLDERYGSGNFEDDDFCIRGLVAGYKARIARDSFVHHFGSQTFKGAGIDYNHSLHHNWELFKKKWGIPADLPYGSYRISLPRNPDLSAYFIPLPPEDQINQLGNEPLIPAPLQPGYAALEAHDLDSALAKFTAAAEQHPAMPEAHTALGQTLLVLGRPKEALKPLRRAIKLDSNQAEAHNLLGKAQYRLGRHDKAKAAFKQAIAADPNNIEARLNLVDFHKSRNDLKQALAMAREALAMGPQNVDVLTTCGLLMLDTDDLTGAEMAWQELPPTASVIHPGVKALMTGLIQRRSTVITPDTLLTAVETAQQAEDWPQAIALLKTLLGMTTGDDRATASLWNRLGVSHHQAGNIIEAMVAFEAALKLAPDAIDLLSNLANIYYNQGQFDKATGYLNRILQIDLDDVNALMLLGNCAIELAEPETALMAFRRVQALAPDTDGIDQLVEQLSQLVQPETAAGPSAGDAVAAPPQVLTAQEAGQWQQAIALVDELLPDAMPGELAALHNSRGYSHFMLEQFEQAEQSFSQGLEHQPDNLNLLNNLAQLYLQQERYDLGTKYLTRALRVNPDDVDTLLAFGNCAIELGDLEAARMAFERVQALAPDTPGVEDVLAHLSKLEPEINGN